MSRFILITGGARSGKSSLAEAKAKELGEKVVYIATAIGFDEGMKERIKKHRSQRPSTWTTIERYKSFASLELEEGFLESDLVLLDCMTLMVSNLLLENDIDFDTCSMSQIDNMENRIFNDIRELEEVIYKHKKQLIIVTNEVGMGLVPSYRLGNIFRDIAGRVNQYLADKADEVYFTVSGIPLKIK
ncbi:adenosylcobinamide kinase /adenosylcobinamide-phosphate guanylyltransferase [Proteiniborus ethanoligenes]|uniref:Adenosylcobinamide kinase n=1 Tax=Proteiniborus ethanoligenes TaxID=415015 RepID=A0A1H3QKD4_9FIRM|nr:bifunctional adenosylcobinamide kinase/adenosylcobinamide-phosphate guanylyltransferase [Proteiniborus ethanoligenes]SDZ13445.1 adenosylcobinamide kinase /adenosylcobinamide-phosphate guanylyltransferase [Proteiniborus ethanoligenes]